jgi:hypothetical protein
MITFMRFAVVAVVVGLALVGCQKKPSLIGTWDMAGGPIPGEQVLAFKEGDVLETTSKFEVPQLGSIEVVSTGSYKLEEAKLTITPKTFEFKGNVPEMLKTVAEGQMNKPQVMTLEWKSDDEIVGTIADSQGQTVTLRRRKQ